MPLRISNTTTDISVLNRWAEEVESNIKKATHAANSALVAVNPAPGTSTLAANFGKITSGDNTKATMTVDTGASLSYVANGIVNANEIGGIIVNGNTPTHTGQLLISQPGNATAVWADPLVQGLQAEGTTTIGLNPVLVGIRGPGNILTDLTADSSGGMSVSSPSLSDLLQILILEVRAMRIAMTALVCDGNKFEPMDFEPASMQDAFTSETILN